MKSLQKYISSVDEAVKVDGVGIGLILRNQKDVDECTKQVSLQWKRLEQGGIRTIDAWKSYAKTVLVQACEAWNQLLVLSKKDKTIRAEDLYDEIDVLFYWVWNTLVELSVGPGSIEMILRNKEGYETFVKTSKSILSAYKSFRNRKAVSISI